ncbi:MAG: hypothetical protein A2Y10_17725 [Planctomycetes bacterium GWF2_41_51]|nr:MAG: hypothetical protein A2Y10_17725 [Planctomycetes bacterium GWF2_41_51]
MNSILKYRVTSLERWGHRDQTPYTIEELEKIKASGYNAVFINGGSGMGPDSISPEMFIKSDVIPDLMPKTISVHKKNIHQRIKKTVEAQLKCWLMWWGIPGPDMSWGTGNSLGTRYLDKTLKYEMHQLLKKTPDIFGSRDPKSCNWRGSRPLCLSNPKVKSYYNDVVNQLCSDYSDIDAITFFPGDHNPDMCDDTCSRCSLFYTRWQIYVEHLNDIAKIVEDTGSNIKLYVILWHSTGDARHWLIENLSSKFGIILTGNDIIYQNRPPYINQPFLSTPMEIIDKRSPCKGMVFEQPWMNISQIGEIAMDNFKAAQAIDREAIVLHEFSQSEVYDPVINFPLPGKIIKMLKKVEDVGFSGFMDFWGNYGPVEWHVNNIAIKYYLEDPEKNEEEILLKTALDITEISNHDHFFNKEIIRLWKLVEKAVDQQAYFTWFQRFHPAIGRTGARGHFYQPLIPNFINLDNRLPSLFVEIAKSWLADGLLIEFAKSQFEDILTFTTIIKAYDLLCNKIQEEGNQRAYIFISKQSLSLKLYTSLLGSVARMLLVINFYNKGKKNDLRNCVSQEIDARSKQIEISKQIGHGVNAEIVKEDISLMKQYIQSSDFPETSMDDFSITSTIYVN